MRKVILNWLSIVMLSVSFNAMSDTTTVPNWQLDNAQSVLSFISTKKGDIAEVHHFTELAGEVTPQGAINFTVDLNSVRTNIDIRDDRMKTILFQTNVFPNATFNAQLASSALSQFVIDETKVMSLSGELALHGDKVKIDADVVVAKLSENTLLVTSKEPVIINAKDFSLVEGINQLKTLAGLPSISHAVPVSFVLVFTK